MVSHEKAKTLRKNLAQKFSISERLRLAVILIATSSAVFAQEAAKDIGRTSFQIGVQYSSRRDLAADTVMVYGVDETLEQRVASWREQGYNVELMTGVAWGNY